MKTKVLLAGVIGILVFATGLCLWDRDLSFLDSFRPSSRRQKWVNLFVAGYKANSKIRGVSRDQCQKYLEKTRELVRGGISYDSSYEKIGYPMGDVPSQQGVCADVVIRTFRFGSLDLQKLVHEDMLREFSSYPNLWHLLSTDTNIDHRRVPNLMTYFSRNAVTLPLSENPEDYQPCDIVAWDLGGGVTHIGVVSDVANGTTPKIIHHIGGQPTEQDVLFRWRIIGHFSF